MQLGLFDDRNLFEFTSPDYPGERLIACKNPQLATLRTHKRRALLEATAKALALITERVAAGRLRGQDRIGVAVGKIINRYKVGRHFDLTIDEGRFDYQINAARVAEEAALDGLHVFTPERRP